MKTIADDIIRTAATGGYIRQIAALYADMDRAYDAAASHYGFSCTGCADNCCLTRFYHHTTIEYAYLLSGFMGLSPDRQRLYQSRARAYNTEMEKAVSGNRPFSHMCPLNDEGWCALYDYRPMICRLHGIPHELAPPGRTKVFGAGCPAFEQHCGDIAYTPFDRTPFYAGMAELERGFRKQTGIAEKFKRTVAGMLISMEKGWS